MSSVAEITTIEHPQPIAREIPFSPPEDTYKVCGNRVAEYQLVRALPEPLDTNQQSIDPLR
jgi:hypothetical protein